MYSVTSVQYRRNLALAVALAGTVGDGGADSGTTVPAETPEQAREAFDSDEPKVNVTIEQDMTISGDEALVVKEGKTVTLTIPEGVTLTGGTMSDSATKDSVITVKSGGTLILDGEGTIEGGDNQYCAIKLTAKGDDYDPTKKATLIINNGKYVGKYYAICGNGTRENTELIINGGEFEGTEPNDSCAVFNPQGNSTVVINGGTFKGAMALVVKSGHLEVNGGEFIANGAKTDYKASGNGFNNTGVAVMVDCSNYPGGNPTADIKGGTFTSQNAEAFGSYSSKGAAPLEHFVDRTGVVVNEAVASQEVVYKA